MGENATNLHLEKLQFFIVKFLKLQSRNSQLLKSTSSIEDPSKHTFMKLQLDIRRDIISALFKKMLVKQESQIKQPVMSQFSNCEFITKKTKIL